MKQLVIPDAGPAPLGLSEEDFAAMLEQALGGNKQVGEILAQQTLYGAKPTKKGEALPFPPPATDFAGMDQAQTISIPDAASRSFFAALDEALRLTKAKTR